MSALRQRWDRILSTKTNEKQKLSSVQFLRDMKSLSEGYQKFS